MKYTREIMKKAAEALTSADGFVDYKKDLLSITSSLTPVVQPNLTCGTQTLTQYRRCFVSLLVRVPRERLTFLTHVMALNFPLIKSNYG